MAKKKRKAFTEERLSLEERAKRRIIDILQKFGCNVLDSKIDKSLSLQDVPPDLKRIFKDFLGTKFDLFVARAKTGEYYLVEVKAKSSERFKNWVNVVEYDAYYEIASLPFPFLYFIWVKATDKIYRHEIVNPKDFKRGEDRYGKPVYLIPRNLIHEIDLSLLDKLNVWLRLTPKVMEEWFKATGTI